MQECAEHPSNWNEGGQLGDYRKLDVWNASGNWPERFTWPARACPTVIVTSSRARCGER